MIKNADNWQVYLVIPACNEEAAISKVLAEIPGGVLQEIIVVDNGSTDHTAARAAEAGATVLSEPRQGYGFACLKGIGRVVDKSRGREQQTILLFMDGDYSDYPAQMTEVLRPIKARGFQMVIGSRVLGKRQKGSLTPQQVFGNWLATRLLYLFYGMRFTDLGPFRAIRLDCLLRLAMQDKTYGWTVEMQIKAARHQLKCTEVPVDYRRRIGISKVSGTVKGTVMAGYKILALLFRYALWQKTSIS